VEARVQRSCVLYRDDGVRCKLISIFIGGDEWMLVAERLGLTPAEIRFLERRCRNPFEIALVHSRNQRYLDVGQLYDVLVDCGFPRFADFL